MSACLTDAEKSARAQARRVARDAELDALVQATVADWPPIPADDLRRIALIFDPPALSDSA